MPYTPDSWANNDPTKPLNAARLTKLGSQYGEVMGDLPAKIADPEDPIGSALSGTFVSVPAGIADGEVPTWDETAETWVPGTGNANITKRAMQVLGSNGSGTATTGTEVLTRRPWLPTVTTSRWRLRHDNLINGSGPAATITTTGLWVAPAAYSSAGAMTGQFASTPTQFLPGWSFNSASEHYVSDWVTDPALQFTAYQQVILSVGMSASASIAFAAGSYASWRNLSAGAADMGDDMAPSLTQSSSCYTALAIEYEAVVSPETPFGLYVGDSLTEAKVHTDAGGISWAQLHAMRTGGVAIVNAQGGASSTSFDSPADYQWTRLPFGEMDVEFACIYLGTNDASASINLATFQTRIASVISAIKTVTGKPSLPIYIGTLTPGSRVGGIETLRLEYNAWLRKLPLGIAGCFDFDLATQDATDPSILDARWAGDNVHGTQAFQNRMAAVVGGRLVP